MKQIYVREMRKMFCAVQELTTKKENKNGYPKRLEAYPETKIVDGKEEILWRYRYSTERFARPIKKAYKFTIHESYREDGKVKVRQAVIATLSYYEIARNSWDYFKSVDKLKDIAEKFNTTFDELHVIFLNKYQEIQKKILEEYEQTEEYKTHERYKSIIAEYGKGESLFNEKYRGLKEWWIDTYAICYDVFGTLKNPEELERLQHAYEVREKRRAARRR